MIRSTRFAALVAVASLILVACGSRVVPLDGFAAGPTGGPQPTGVPTGFIPTDPSSGPIPGNTTGPIPSGLPSTSPTPILPECRGGASDVGVTSDTIKIGLIASITGPLPGQFNSAVEAVDAHFKAVNDAGGVCGRKIQLIIRDDNGDGSTNLRIAEQMAREHKIFAFIGSHAAPDDSGIAKVSARDKIPDIGFPLTWERAENPYTYGVPGQLQRDSLGEGAAGSKYLNKTLDVQEVAIFWLKESEVSILSAWGFEAAMMRSTNGRIRICHEQPAGVLDNNYTNYVVSMQGKCDPKKTAVYTTMENNANIKLAIAMRDQNFKPRGFITTFSSYLPSFISEADGATEGAYMAMPQIPLERLQRPQSEWTPGTYELARYITALKRYFPNHRPPGSFGGPAWASAGLFIDVAAHCGAKLTRSCVFKRLNTMGPYAASGFVSPTRPGDHVIYTKDLIVQVRNGQFVELRPNDRSGPVEAPDFWNQSQLFNWHKYYCSHKSQFPNTQAKDRLVDC